MNVKQVIVMRTDLGMRKGKMCAQAAHASMKVFFDNFRRLRLLKGEFNGKTFDGGVMYHVSLPAELCEWVDGLFTKIVVGIDSEEKLKALHTEVLLAGLPCALIEDAGLTEFHGVTTPTCIAIGPAKSEDIDPFTKDLKLI